MHAEMVEALCHLHVLPEATPAHEAHHTGPSIAFDAALAAIVSGAAKGGHSFPLVALRRVDRFELSSPPAAGTSATVITADEDGADEELRARGRRAVLFTVMSDTTAVAASTRIEPTGTRRGGDGKVDAVGGEAPREADFISGGGSGVSTGGTEESIHHVNSSDRNVSGKGKEPRSPESTGWNLPTVTMRADTALRFGFCADDVVHVRALPLPVWLSSVVVIANERCGEVSAHQSIVIRT